MSKKQYNIAIAGATGAVGLEMIKILEQRNFPVKSLSLLASKDLWVSVWNIEDNS